nr:hypothetical protein BSM_34450 [uncultured archaeon]
MVVVSDTDILSMFAKIFATNDDRAREFAKSEGSQVFPLQAILKVR